MDVDNVLTTVETKAEPWVKRAFNSTDLTADVKPLAFILVVLAGIFICIAQWFAKRLTTDLIQFYTALAYLVGGGGALWSGVERWKQVPKSSGGGTTTTTSIAPPTPPPPPVPPVAPVPPVPPAPPTPPADSKSTTTISAKVVITDDTDPDPGTPTGKAD